MCKQCIDSHWLDLLPSCTKLYSPTAPCGTLDERLRANRILVQSRGPQTQIVLIWQSGN